MLYVNAMPFTDDRMNGDREDGADEEAAAEDEVYDEEEQDGDIKPGARPRRLSEVKIADKIKPIPNASSLFVFKPDNRYALFGACPED